MIKGCLYTNIEVSYEDAPTQKLLSALAFHDLTKSLCPVGVHGQ